MTLNSAEMKVDELVDCVMPLIRKRDWVEGWLVRRALGW